MRDTAGTQRHPWTVDKKGDLRSSKHDMSVTATVQVSGSCFCHGGEEKGKQGQVIQM